MNVPGTIALSELDRLRLEAAVDQSIRESFVKDPVGMLKKRGIDVPNGVTIQVVEDTNQSHTITVPPFVGNETSKAALKAQLGGDPATWACTTCTTTTPICAGSLASLICLGQK